MNLPKNNIRRSILAASIAALVGNATSAHADSAIWNGSVDALSVWSDVNNWDGPPAAVPGTGNTATFNSAGGVNDVIDLGAGVTISTLAFDTASAAAYTIGTGAVGSQTLTLDNGGSVTLSSTVANDELINAAIVLGNDGTTQTFTLNNASATNLLTIAGGITGSTGAGIKTLAVAGAGNTTLSGIIGDGTTGTVALTKSDGGTLTLSNTNGYAGGTTINGGIVNASAAGALGAGGVTNNGTLNLTATAAGDATYTGLSTSMSGSGILNVSLLTGTSTRVLNGNYSAFNGTINIGVGTVAGGGKVQLNGLDHTDAVVNVNTNATLYVAAAVTKNAELVLNGGDTGESLGQLRLENGANWAGGVTLAGNVAAGDFTIGNSGGTGTISGIISETGTRALSKGGGGTITLSNANLYTGATTVGGGALVMTNNAALGTSAAGAVVTAGSLELGNGIISPSAKSVTITGFGTVGGAFGALRANTGSSTWTGNVIIASALGAAPDTRVGANAGATLTITGSILGSGTGQNIGISGGAGTGKVIFNPTTNNNYAGSTSVFRGTLELGKSNVIPDTSALALGGGSVTDANLFNMAGFSETVFSLLRTTGSAIAANISNTGASLSTLTLDGTGSTGSTTYVGNILIGTGNIKLVKAGGTTQVLQNTVSNTFTGGLDVKGGGFTLDLNSMTTPTNLISASNAVSLGGGGATTLTVLGKTAGASSQTFNGTTLNTANIALSISRNTTGTSASLNFGALTRNAGSMLNFQPATAWVASTASTTEIVTTTGINGGALPGADAYIGAWATVGTGVNTRYAQLKSTGAFIMGPTSTVATANLANVTDANIAYSYTTGATLAGNQTGYALLWNATTAQTVALGANTLTLNGFLGVNTGTAGFTATSGALQVGAENELVLNTASGSLTISAPIINKTAATDSRLTIGGAGTTTLSGANSYGGATTLNGGTLSIASDVLGAVPVSATPGNLALNGGTLASTATMTINANRGVALNGAIGIAPSAGTTLTIPGIIAGQGLLTKTTAGTLILSGANTFTGAASGLLGPGIVGVAVNGGTLVLANPSALGPAGNSINLGTQAGTGLELATDSTVNAYGLSTSSSNPTTIVLNRATVGAGFNHALGMGIMGNNVLNVTSGAKVTSGTASISITGINLAAGGTGSLTLNPINTSISVTGPVFIGGNNFAKTLGLGGNSTGNSVSGDLSNGLNTLSLAKSGASTWTVSGNNSHTGTASVTGGTLKLDYSTNNTSKLADGAALTLGGGTLEISGGSHNEVVSATTLTANTGSKLIRTNSATGVIQLNAITGNAGALLNIGGSSIASTDTLNDVSTGILGPWATVTNAGVTDWAINSTNTADGLITAYAGYTDISRFANGPAGTVPNTPAANGRIVDAGTTGDITLAAATTQINTLKVGATSGTATVALAGQVLSIGGNTGGAILQDSTAGGLTVGSAANDGTLTTGGVADAVPASLHFANMSTANAVLLNSAITDNGTDVVSVAKSGAGKVTLAGTNLFSGSANVSEGVLEITGTLATTAVTAGTNGTLRLSNAAALGAGATVTIGASGKLDLNGNNSTITNLAGDAAGIVTDDAAGTGISTLTLSFAQTGTVNNLFLDGATRDVAISLNNPNAGHAMLSNAGNTFSGGLILANNNVNGTRLVISATPATTGTPGALTSGVYGTGPIIVGQATTDKAGIYINGNNVTINNAITMNTVLGTDRPGIRIDATGAVLAGTLTAGLSDILFSTNNATATSASVTGQITGSQGLRLGGAFGSALTVTLANVGTANNYAGNTTINADAAAGRSMTLTLGAANQIPNGAGKGDVVINTSTTGVGTLNLAGFSETINGLSGNGTVTSATGADLFVGDNDATSIFSGAITNSLNLTKIGLGTQTLSGASTYGGTTLISTGTIIAQNSAALGANTAGTTVSSGATLDLGGTLAINALNLGAEVISISGTGVGGNGALVNNGSNDQQNAVQRLTLAGDATIGGTKRWDVRGAGSILNGNFALTKVGTNQVSLVATTVSVKDINVNGGQLTIEFGANVNNTNAGTISVGSSGTLGAGNFGSAISVSKPIALANGAIFKTTSTGANGDAAIAADIALTGTSFINPQATSTLTLNGILSGGGFTLNDAGTVVLAGANTHSGTTTLAAGTLSLANVNALQNSTLDVGAAGAQTLNLTVAGTNTYNLGGLKGADPIAIGANTLSVGADLENTTYSGDITGTGAFTKVGAGSIVLEGLLGTGGLTLNGNGGTTRIAQSQTLAALNIADGATVILSALPPPSPAPAFDGGDVFAAQLGSDASGASLQGVPEPGSAALLFGGILTLLGVRRRRA